MLFVFILFIYFIKIFWKFPFIKCLDANMFNMRAGCICPGWGSWDGGHWGSLLLSIHYQWHCPSHHSNQCPCGWFATHATYICRWVSGICILKSGLSPLFAYGHLLESWSCAWPFLANIFNIFVQSIVFLIAGSLLFPPHHYVTFVCYVWAVEFILLFSGQLYVMMSPQEVLGTTNQRYISSLAWLYAI